MSNKGTIKRPIQANAGRHRMEPKDRSCQRSIRNATTVTSRADVESMTTVSVSRKPGEKVVHSNRGRMEMVSAIKAAIAGLLPLLSL